MYRNGLTLTRWRAGGVVLCAIAANSGTSICRSTIAVSITGYHCPCLHFAGSKERTIVLLLILKSSLMEFSDGVLAWKLERGSVDVATWPMVIDMCILSIIVVSNFMESGRSSRERYHSKLVSYHVSCCSNQIKEPRINCISRVNCTVPISHRFHLDMLKLECPIPGKAEWQSIHFLVSFLLLSSSPFSIYSTINWFSVLRNISKISASFQSCKSDQYWLQWTL